MKWLLIISVASKIVPSIDKTEDPYSAGLELVCAISQKIKHEFTFDVNPVLKVNKIRWTNLLQDYYVYSSHGFRDTAKSRQFSENLIFKV